MKRPGAMRTRRRIRTGSREPNENQEKGGHPSYPPAVGVSAGNPIGPSTDTGAVRWLTTAYPATIACQLARLDGTHEATPERRRITPTRIGTLRVLRSPYIRGRARVCWITLEDAPELEGFLISVVMADLTELLPLWFTHRVIRTVRQSSLPRTTQQAFPDLLKTFDPLVLQLGMLMRYISSGPLRFVDDWQRVDGVSSYPERLAAGDSVAARAGSLAPYQALLLAHHLLPEEALPGSLRAFMAGNWLQAAKANIPPEAYVLWGHLVADSADRTRVGMLLSNNIDGHTFVSDGPILATEMTVPPISEGIRTTTVVEAFPPVDRLSISGRDRLHDTSQGTLSDDRTFVLWAVPRIDAGEIERRHTVTALEPLIAEILAAADYTTIPSPQHEELLEAVRLLQSDIERLRGETGLTAARKSAIRSTLTALASACAAVALNVVASAIWDAQGERIMHLVRLLA